MSLVRNNYPCFVFFLSRAILKLTFLLHKHVKSLIDNLYANLFQAESFFQYYNEEVHEMWRDTKTRILDEEHDFIHLQPGFKIRQIFFGAERSGGAVLAKISGAERSGGAVPSKKFGAERSGGAEISKKFDFFGVFHEFFANYCSRGTKTLTHYSWRSLTVFRHLFEKYKVQNPLCVQKFTWSGAERWSGVSKNRWSGAELERSAPLPPLRSAQNPLHRSMDFEPCAQPFRAKLKWRIYLSFHPYGIKSIIISPSKMGRANLCIDKTTIHFIYFFSTAIYQSTEIRVKKTKSESWQKSQKIFVRLLFPLHNASMTKQNRQNASCLEVIQSVSTRQKCSKLEAASTGKNINILLELDWLCSLSRVSSVCWH